MEIQNLQEYINNYEITNHINASIFVLSILNHFTNNNQVINNIYYIDSELILTTYGKTFYIINYNDKEEIIENIKDLIFNSKQLMQQLNNYKFNGDYRPPFDIKYILSITKHIDMDIFTQEHKLRVKTNNYQLDINKLIKDYKYLNINTEEEKLPAAILVEEKLLSAVVIKDEDEKVEETEYENIEENDGNNLNTIDDITKYLDDLKFPKSMITEIKDNIENLKELLYVYGKLQKEEYKKFVITQQHKNSVSRDIIDTKNYINKLMPRNVKDKIEFQKLYMSDYEVKLCFNMHYKQTSEYKDGLNN